MARARATVASTRGYDGVAHTAPSHAGTRLDQGTYQQVRITVTVFSTGGRASYVSPLCSVFLRLPSASVCLESSRMPNQMALENPPKPRLYPRCHRLRSAAWPTRLHGRPYRVNIVFLCAYGRGGRARVDSGRLLPVLRTSRSRNRVLTNLCARRYGAPGRAHLRSRIAETHTDATA